MPLVLRGVVPELADAGTMFGAGEPDSAAERDVIPAPAPAPAETPDVSVPLPPTDNIASAAMDSVML